VLVCLAGDAAVLADRLSADLQRAGRNGAAAGDHGVGQAGQASGKLLAGADQHTRLGRRELRQAVAAAIVVVGDRADNGGGQGRCGDTARQSARAVRRGHLGLLDVPAGWPVQQHSDIGDAGHLVIVLI